MNDPKIVFVHGSWHWSGCFYKLEMALKSEGYTDVVSINNASHGDDTTLWNCIDSMATYNANLIKTLSECTKPVVLIGHSMGGVSLTHLADIMPEKISKLVYMSGFMTPKGKTANDYILPHVDSPLNASLWAVLYSVNKWAGIGCATDKPKLLKDVFYGDCSDKDIAFSTANFVEINTGIPNLYRPNSTSAIERHYIQCTLDHAVSHQAQKEMCADVPGTIIHSLDTSHSPFYAKPNETAALLQAIISR